MRFRYRNIAFGALLACVFSISFVPSAHADAIYAYTGNNFTNFSGFTCGPECNLTGSLTYSQALAANQSFTNAPVAFSFTDGSNVLTLANAPTDLFKLNTDSSGNIAGWDITAATKDSSSFIRTTNLANENGFLFDVTAQGSNFAYNMNNPGSWTVSNTVSTPEPSSVLLFGTGLLGIALISLHKRIA